MINQTITFQELLRLAFDQRIIWINGETRSPHTINWICSRIEQIQTNDLLLLLGKDADHQTIEMASKKGAAGVIILGTPEPGIILDKIDLPILSLPTVTDIRFASQSLLSTLVNQRAAALERSAKIYTQLLEFATEGKGLNGLANFMQEICGHGVLIQDKRGRLLADRPSSSLLGIWPDVLEQLGALSSLPEYLKDRKLAGQQSLLTTQTIPGGLERLIKPISVGKVARGYISLIATKGELDILDQVVLEQGCLVGSIEMARHKAVREAEKRLKGDLLTALLQDDIAPRDARLWAQSMGLDLNQAHVALRFAWDIPNAPSRRRLETLVNGEISRLGIKAIVTLMVSEVTCICQISINNPRPNLAFELGQATIDQGLFEYPDGAIRCGVGTPAQDLSAWRDSFRQAGQALEMARRLNESKPLYFPDLSVYRLLLQIEHNPEMTAFLEEILGPLLDYEGGYDLIQTLEAYFQNIGNLSQTAEALFIHRNTLLYRMERIQEILALDLDNPTSRLAVQLALYIYQMVGRQSNK